MVTVFQISEICGNAYIQAAINAFRKCGMWPYNQNNFTDADFISAATTDIQNIENSSSVEQQRVSEAEGPQYEVVPSVPSTTVATTVSSTATTSHLGAVTTRPEVTTESCTPIRIDFITDCNEQVTPETSKTPAPEPEPGCSFASKSPIRAAILHLALKMYPLVIFCRSLRSNGLKRGSNTGEEKQPSLLQLLIKMSWRI